jgi:hypothetical protein
MLDSSVVGSRIVKRRAWTYIRRIGCAAAAFALFSGLALTQTNPEQKSPQSTFPAADSQQSPEATFRAHTDLVVIPVTVTDTLNRFVLGLQKEDFHLDGYLLDSPSPYRLWFRFDLRSGVKDSIQANGLDCQRLLHEAKEELTAAF